MYNRDTSDYEQGVEEEEEEEKTDYETDKQIEASVLTKTDPNNQRSLPFKWFSRKIRIINTRNKT